MFMLLPFVEHGLDCGELFILHQQVRSTGDGPDSRCIILVVQYGCLHTCLGFLGRCPTTPECHKDATGSLSSLLLHHRLLNLLLLLGNCSRGKLPVSLLGDLALALLPQHLNSCRLATGVLHGVRGGLGSSTVDLTIRVRRKCRSPRVLSRQRGRRDGPNSSAAGCEVRCAEQAQHAREDRTNDATPVTEPKDKLLPRRCLHEVARKGWRPFGRTSSKVSRTGTRLGVAFRALLGGVGLSLGYPGAVLEVIPSR
mmetsp:Transcript_18040/g.52708  ORF Transcript_18040/g.52708 Transcript_18040/m.52708 type:complete len:254 (-) Transcript_18040:171-932(-)